MIPAHSGSSALLWTQQVELPADVRSILAPPEDLLPHQWVEKYRRMQEQDAAPPGEFRFDRIPYMVEPTDAFADPGVRSIVLIKASRCSGTGLINKSWPTRADVREAGGGNGTTKSRRHEAVSVSIPRRLLSDQRGSHGGTETSAPIWKAARQVRRRFVPL